MRRLVIAVDCDDVLLPSMEYIINAYNTRYDTNVPLELNNSTDRSVWQASPEEVGERIYDIQLSPEYAKVLPFNDAIEACRRLANQHELHLVTARPGRVMAVTIAMLEEYFKGVFKEIEHVGFNGNKGEICRLLKADVLIDDSLSHLEAAKACEIPNLLWFGDYSWNKATELPAGIVRCLDWRVVEQEINAIATRR